MNHMRNYIGFLFFYVTVSHFISYAVIIQYFHRFLSINPLQYMNSCFILLIVKIHSKFIIKIRKWLILLINFIK